MKAPGAQVARPVRRFGLGWLGMVPFLAFAFLFLVAPTFYLVVGSLQTASGAFTLQNFADLFTPQIIATYANSLEISIVTALIGGVFGFLLAYAVISGGLPGILRSALMTFSGRRLELRRHPAGPGLRLHRRPDRPVHRLPQGNRDRPVQQRLHDLLEDRARDRLPLLPVPADGPDHRPGDRRPEEGLAGSRREHGRQLVPVLAPGGPADPDAVPARIDDPALRQLVRGAGHRLPADRRVHRHRDDRDLAPDARRRPVQPEPGLRPGDGHGRSSWPSRSPAIRSSSAGRSAGSSDRQPQPVDHGHAIEKALGPGEHGTAPARGAGRVRGRYVARIAWWVVFLIGFLYFFVPLYGTLDFALKSKPFGSAFTAILSDSQFVSTLDLLVHRRGPDRDRQHPDHRADGLLGPPQVPAGCGRSSSSSRCCRS